MTLLLLRGKRRPSLAANLLAQSWAEAGFTYTRSGPMTGFGADGLLWTAADNEDRLDYDPVTLQPLARFTWPQRTNFALRSQEFDHSYWTAAVLVAGTGVGVTVTANHAVSPDGTQNADRIQFNKGAGTGSGDYAYIEKAVTIGAANPHDETLSCWMRSTDGVSSFTLWFDAGNGTPQTIVVTGQWQRFAITNLARASINGLIRWGLRGSITGSPATADILAWSMQTEVGPGVTAYIPTTAAAVTRFAPSITRATGPWFNPDRGTLICDFLNVNGSAPATERLFWIGPGSPRLTVRRSAAQNAPTFDVNNAGGVIAGVVGNNLTANTRHAIAVAYESDYFALAQDRVIVGTDTAGTMGGTLDTTLTVAGGGGGAPLVAGWRRFAYCPAALRSAALQGAAA